MLNRNQTARFCAALALGSLLTGCILKPSDTVEVERPGWIEQKPVREGHLYGVGFAGLYGGEIDAQAQARLQARYQLERQLNMQQESGHLGKAWVSHNLSGAVRGLFADNTGEKALPGLEWQAQWHDKRQHQVYVLAHLNRDRSARLLSAQIDELDDVLNQADVPKQSHLESARYTMEQLALFSRRDDLRAQHQRVSGEPDALPLSGSLQVKRDRFYDLLSELNVCLSARNKGSLAMEPALAQAVTQSGFVLASQKVCASPHHSGVDLELEYTLNTEQLKRAGHYYILADGHFALKDHQGRTLYAFSHNVKGVSALREQAEKKAINQLSAMLQKSVLRSLITVIH